MLRSLILVTLAVSVIVTGAGCDAATQARNAAKKQQMANNLKQLGLAYHNFYDSNAKPPTGWSDVATFGVPTDVQQQLSAYTVHWGTDIRKVTTGTASFVLAYPPGAATAGGQVLMLDGSVQNVTAQEFNELIAAQSAAPASEPAGETAPMP
jgi:hypothetical protein